MEFTSLYKINLKVSLNETRTPNQELCLHLCLYSPLHSVEQGIILSIIHVLLCNNIKLISTEITE